MLPSRTAENREISSGNSFTVDTKLTELSETYCSRCFQRDLIENMKAQVT